MARGGAHTRAAATPLRQTAAVKSGEAVTFEVRGTDQHGRSMAVAEAKWSATGGTIDERGRYTAGADEGTHGVEVVVGAKRARATVTIAKEDVPLRPPSAKPGATSIRWSGAVPPLKWMNFYTQVLAGFVTPGGNLRVNVSFEAAPEARVSAQQIEKTRAALRELGLDDSVQTGG